MAAETDGIEDELVEDDEGIATRSVQSLGFKSMSNAMISEKQGAGVLVVDEKKKLSLGCIFEVKGIYMRVYYTRVFRSMP